MINIMTKNKGVLYTAYFVSVIIIGSIGFYYIGDEQWSLVDSVYMTIITLFFVGFSEVHPLTELGRLWAIIVIFFWCCWNRHALFKHARHNYLL